MSTYYKANTRNVCLCLSLDVQWTTPITDVASALSDSKYYANGFSTCTFIHHVNNSVLRTYYLVQITIMDVCDAA